jgi:hypothetical protein
VTDHHRQNPNNQAGLASDIGDEMQAGENAVQTCYPSPRLIRLHSFEAGLKHPLLFAFILCGCNKLVNVPSPDLWRQVGRVAQRLPGWLPVEPKCSSRAVAMPARWWASMCNLLSSMSSCVSDGVHSLIAYPRGRTGAPRRSLFLLTPQCKQGSHPITYSIVDLIYTLLTS